MLDDWAKYQLKLNHVNEEDVESMTTDMKVLFKDGTERRICQVWSRVMGYLRPTTDYNVGKYSEFMTRKYFTEDSANCNGETPDDAA